jgi:aspartate aminotransferase
LAIAERLRQAGCEVPNPQGGFYLFPDLSSKRERLSKLGIHGGRQLCQRLLDDTGVATLPGSDFGRPAGELSLRLAYVNFDGGEALAGAAKLEARRQEPDAGFLEAYCAPVMEGIERLATWIEGP